MKRMVIMSMIGLLMIGISVPAQAHQRSFAAQKLKNGVSDLLTAPASIFTSTSERVSKSNDKLTGFVVGLIEGADSFVNKTFSGVVNIVTFPIPIGDVENKSRPVKISY